MSDNKTTGRTAVMERLRVKATERAMLRDRVAQLLYESGEMTADCEEGSMPSWDEAAAGDDHMGILIDHRQRANALLGLGAKECLELSRILAGIAATKFDALEADLWAKVERAKGYETGSLRGWPGVKQKVAL